MTSAIRFIHARIPTAQGLSEASLTIRDGKISAVDGSSETDTKDVDLEGAWLLPGAIDGHVHFDDPGFTHREDFSSGTRAAAAGGVTTIVDMPCTSLPPITDGQGFNNRLSVVLPKAHVDFQFWGGVRGNDFEEKKIAGWLDELMELGVRSVKTYLISGMDTFEDLTADQLRTVLWLAKERGLVVGVHAEDKAMVESATRQALSSSDKDMPAAYARARSAEAETEGVSTCIRLAEETGASVHVVHLACGRGLELIREAKAKGISITAETCPHYLAFTDQDLDRMGGLLKTAPVVKGMADQEALWGGLLDGSIDMVATDHAPGVYPGEKRTGSIWTDYGGVPGVETLLPFLMSEGVSKGRISLWQAVQLLSEGPARIHFLSSKGRLQKGFDADLVVFDPKQSMVVKATQLNTRQKYTPFENMVFQGRVQQTYLRGILVYDMKKGIVGKPNGRLVRMKQ
jgi:allantoinase